MLQANWLDMASALLNMLPLDQQYEFLMQIHTWSGSIINAIDESRTTDATGEETGEETTEDTGEDTAEALQPPNIVHIPLLSFDN